MAAGQAAGSVSKSAASAADFETQADEVKVQEKIGALQYSRDVKDTKEATEAALARRRALMAAGGMAGTAQGTALLDAAAATSGQNLSRMATDYAISRSSLRARRKNLKDAAMNARITMVTDPLKFFSSAAPGAGGATSSYGATGKGKLIHSGDGRLVGGV